MEILIDLLSSPVGSGIALGLAMLYLATEYGLHRQVETRRIADLLAFGLTVLLAIKVQSTAVVIMTAMAGLTMSLGLRWAHNRAQRRKEDR